ncbi:autotransporter outer membrane beta-barrel domain-containing protein [Labrys okinawensis]|uniref:autotransporter outer membrane beta-barrel domain-containing protein n=1 Tax=Labrys okinawensis TaxID=346911 RepID=UPI0015E2CD8A|nr:autotransporter outer membrane beta-barrel domain-containing protein [Labrys okinawensis]
MNNQTVDVPGTQPSPWNVGNLFIGMPDTGTVNVLAGGTVNVNGVLAVGRSGTGNLNLSGGGQTKASSTVIGQLANSTGIATVTGAGSTLTSTGSLVVGGAGNGTLDVDAGGKAVGGAVIIGNAAGSTGNATVSGAGSSLTSNVTMVIGGAGTGALRIENGGSVTNANSPSTPAQTTIGQQAGSNGSVVVTGSGSTFDAGSYLFVGYAGQGSLRIEDGAKASSSDFATIAYAGSANGSSMVVTGAGSAWSSYGMNVGGSSYNGIGIPVGGQASLLIEDGGQVNTTSGSIGYSGTPSIATITGAGSKWTATSGLTVESSTLNLEDGGQVQTGYLCVNCSNGYGPSAINVTGAGSKLVASNQLSILYGTTTVDVTAGGAIESGITHLSYYGGSNTTATVSGGGSSWTTTGELIVGRLGTASLTVEDGAKLKTASATIAQMVDTNAGITSSGTVKVTGAGSSWENTGTLVVAENGKASLTVDNGAKVTSGTTTIARFDGSDGTVTVTGAGSSLAVTGDMSVGNSGATGVVNLTEGGTASVTGTVGVGGGFSPNGTGTINIGTGGLAGNLTAGQVTSYSQTGATVNFNHTDDITFTPAMTSASPDYKLAVNQMNSGTTVLMGQSTYYGLTTVSAGMLQAGAANAFSPNSDVKVTAGTLDAGGFNQTVKSLTNAGTVATNLKGGPPGTTLTVTGDYVGDGPGVSRLIMNTYLASDNSPTDKLIVNGDVSGTTTLTIHNVGGPGAATTADGIEIIQVGGTSEAGAFSLDAAVAAGAYDYNLYLGGVGDHTGSQNWYLRSTGKLSPNSQTALPYADVLSTFAQATLGTLQQRTGNRIWPEGAPRFAADSPASGTTSYARGGPVLIGQGAWGRMGGQYSSFAPSKGSAYDQSIGFLQAGYEGVAKETAAGDLTIGAYATIGTSTARIDVSNDPVTGAIRAKGRITTQGYGIGANLTWLGHDGLYADAIGQFTWYDSSLSNKNGRNQGWSSAASLEVGKRYELGSGWAVVPQAQLAWTHVDFSSFTDNLGNRIALGRGDSLQGRAGLRVEHLSSWADADGQTARLQFYGIANLTYEFLKGRSVKVSGTSLVQSNRRLWGEIGAGATYGWNKNWSAYGEASYAMALSGKGGDNYTLKGTAGLRYRW